MNGFRQAIIEANTAINPTSSDQSPSGESTNDQQPSTVLLSIGSSLSIEIAGDLSSSLNVSICLVRESQIGSTSPLEASNHAGEVRLSAQIKPDTRHNHLMQAASSRTGASPAEGDSQSPQSKVISNKLQRLLRISEPSVSTQKASHTVATGQSYASAESQPVCHPTGEDHHVEIEQQPTESSEEENIQRTRSNSTIRERLQEVDTDASEEVVDKVGSRTPGSVPEIRIHKPTDSEDMAAALGTSVMNNTPVSPTSAAIPSPVENVTQAATSASSNVPATPLPSPAAPAVPMVEIPHVQLPATDIPAVAAAVDAKKPKRRRRIIHKVRKLLLRPRVLGILLGRETAKVVGQQLGTANGATAVVPTQGPL